MTAFSNFPSIFVPLTGIVLPAITMVSLFLYLQTKKIF